MTKQAGIGVSLIITWMVLGIINVISSSDMMIGLIGFMIGMYITAWENGDVNHAKGEQ